jgi:hypothetical protein
MPKHKLQENDTDHFNANVPQALRDKVNALAILIKDDFIDDCGSGESFGNGSITAIYGYHISGFIPLQLGGYEISTLYRHDIDPTYHITKAQSESAHKQEKDCYESFARDYWEELTKEGVSLPEGWCSEDLPLGMRETFYDYENEWFTPALLRCELWVDDDERKQRIGVSDDAMPSTIHICMGLNYRDQPYYRTQSDEQLFTLEIPVSDFMLTPIETYLQVIKEKMDKVE